MGSSWRHAWALVGGGVRKSRAPGIHNTWYNGGATGTGACWYWCWWFHLLMREYKDDPSGTTEQSRSVRCDAPQRPSVSRPKGLVDDPSGFLNLSIEGHVRHSQRVRVRRLTAQPPSASTPESRQSATLGWSSHPPSIPWQSVQHHATLRRSYRLIEARGRRTKLCTTRQL